MLLPQVSIGANNFGQLGRETPDTHDAQPGLVDLLPLSRGPCQGQSLEEHSAAQDPAGSATAATGATGVTVKDLSCGDDHALIVLSDESVYVWGRGTQGALGLGSQVACFYILFIYRCVNMTVS